MAELADMHRCPGNGHMIKSTHGRVPGRQRICFLPTVSVVCFLCKRARRMMQTSKAGLTRHQKLASLGYRALTSQISSMSICPAHGHMLILAGSWLVGTDVGAAPLADHAESSSYPLRERTMSKQTKPGIVFTHGTDGSSFSKLIPTLRGRRDTR